MKILISLCLLLLTVHSLSVISLTESDLEQELSSGKQIWLVHRTGKTLITQDLERILISLRKSMMLSVVSSKLSLSIVLMNHSLSMEITVRTQLPTMMTSIQRRLSVLSWRILTKSWTAEQKRPNSWKITKNSWRKRKKELKRNGKESNNSAKNQTQSSLMPQIGIQPS